MYNLKQKFQIRPKHIPIAIAFSKLKKEKKINLYREFVCTLKALERKKVNRKRKKKKKKEKRRRLEENGIEE